MDARLRKMTDPPADDRDAGDRRFLTVEQVAQLRRVTPAAIRAQLRAGTLAGEQVLQGQRTVWRIPASAAPRPPDEPGGPADRPDPAAAPGGPPGVRPAVPGPPSDPESGAPATGRPRTGAPVPTPSTPSTSSASWARVAALEAEVHRLRRQLSVLADAHHRLLDAVTAGLADDPADDVVR
jgi:hypothetical protein